MHKPLITSFLTVLICLLGHLNSYATHGMGMDLTYQCLGGNSYSFQLAFYRDCGGVAAPASANITFRSASCNRNFTRTLAFFSRSETTPVCASLSTECTGGIFPGAEEYLYRGTFTLPAQCNDWVISYSLCCRNNDINTINNPGAADIYTETTLDNTLANCNSSPSFSNDPVPFVCSNQTYCFNNGAVDADGDSLVYSLVTPRTGPNPGDTVVFLPTFSSGHPITSVPNLTLDSVTGDMCMFPTDSTQIGVLAVLVEEYRNGVKIGTIRRDIQLRILGCPNGNVSPTVSGIDTSTNYNIKVCAGDTLDFLVFSQDPDTGQQVTMAWNNAIPAATFNISGGNRPVGNFVWTPNNTDIRQNPYCFTVSVEDDNCPFVGAQVFSYCIFVTGITSLVDSIDQPSCNSFCDGVGAVQIVNGTPPYTYLWNDPKAQKTDIADSLCAGIYTITGTDSVGCVTTTNIAITEPDTLRATGIVVSNYNGADISCADSSDGAVSATPIGGTAPYSFQWDAAANNQITDTATGLPEGTYGFTITDANGCDTNGTVQLVDPPSMTLGTQVISDYNGRMISCVGSADGSLLGSATGGTGQYNYLWTGNGINQNNDTANGLPAGIYNLTVTDENGCEVKAVDSLENPPAIVTTVNLASDYNGTPISCADSSDGAAVVSASGGTPGFSYLWDATANNQATDTAKGLATGTYIVTATDTNGCTAVDSIFIDQPQPILATIIAKTDVFCNGQSTGQARAASIGGTAPYRYSWNTSPVTMDSNITGLAMGTYTVTATDTNGCMDDTTIMINESLPISANVNGQDPSCNAVNDGIAFATPTGGNPPFRYFWTTNVGNQSTDTARNLSGTKHFLILTDSLNCTTTDSITLVEPAPVQVNVSANDTLCEGTMINITAQGVGGRGTLYDYLWNEGLGNADNHNVTPTNTTLYIVRAVDSLGCVSQPEVISIFIRNFDEDSLAVFSNGNVCVGDTTSVVAQHIAKFDQYTYTWRPGPGTDVGPINITPDSSGFYTLTISDICNNEIADSVFVEVYPLPEVTLPDTIAEGCSPLLVNFSDSLNQGLGYQYNWNFGDGGSSIDPLAAHLYPNAGVFEVNLTAISQQGCSATTSSAGIVNVFNKPIVSFDANPIATTTQNPTIDFSNSTQFGGTYFWSFGDDSTSSIINPSHTYSDSGLYQVWLISENGSGCIDSASQFIQIDPYFEIEIPNAFSPNPNGSSNGSYDPEALNNDVFFPHTTGVDKYKLLIYNRWGELIFESTKHEIGWDGYYKGELAQQEVYIYELDITWINGQTFKKVGDLTLFR